jgi:hypothetical protein
MMERPSERIVGAANAELTARAADGRVLTLRRLGALDRLRLFKAVGAVLAENPPYLGMVMLAASVTAIDAIPVPPPVTEAQLEALVQRLGDDGMLAVADALDGAEHEQVELTTAGN